MKNTVLSECLVTIFATRHSLYAVYSIQTCGSALSNTYRQVKVTILKPCYVMHGTSMSSTVLFQIIKLLDHANIFSEEQFYYSQHIP